MMAARRRSWKMAKAACYPHPGICLPLREICLSCSAIPSFGHAWAGMAAVRSKRILRLNEWPRTQHESMQRSCREMADKLNRTGAHVVYELLTGSRRERHCRQNRILLG